MSLKKYIKKSVAAYIAISMLYSNFYLCGLGISDVIAQDIKEPNIEMNLENVQYVQFNEKLESGNEEQQGEEVQKEYNTGVAIKSKLQIGLEEQESQLPIKGAEVAVSLPVINGILPERANIVLANTQLTTGEEDKSINQNYDVSSGLLTMSFQNEMAYSNYNKDSKDEFEIIYIYPAESYTGNVEELTLQYSVNSKMIFETENGEITSEEIQGFELKEEDNKGDLLEFNVTKFDNPIYKGFMYSNVENATNYETEYNTVSSLCVLNSNSASELTMEIEENEFVLNDEDNSQIPTSGRTIYKSTEISKEQFDKILGQDGIIEIFNGETLLATVGYIAVSENDEIVNKLAVIYSDDNMKLLSPEETNAKIEYGENITSLLIKTTKPIAEGYLNFKNQNVIIPTRDYIVSVEDIRSINTISTINEVTKNTEILLLEPETKILVNSSNVNFSTLQNNTTTLTINLDSTNIATKLFDNPTLKIKLPEGVVGGNVSSPSIINGNGLKLKGNPKQGETSNIIIIELEGKQTEYDLNNVSGGTAIVMDIENLDYEDTIPAHTDWVEVTCIQGNERVSVKQDVNIVSKAGLLMMSTLTGYDKNNDSLKSIDSELKTVEVNSDGEKKELIQTIDLVNNYDENITNVEILGRLGYTDQIISSNFNLALIKPIETSKGKVYYSTNKDATYNDESWSEEFISEAKAYKIEINNNEFIAKEKCTLKLFLNVPANLNYNKESYVKTEINYTYNENDLRDSSTIGILTEKSELATHSKDYAVSIMNDNGEKVPVSVVITPQVTQNYVHAGQTVTYNIKIINNGNEDLNNITVEDIIPDNAIYTYEKVIEGEVATYSEIEKDEQTKSVTWKMETLRAGESAECEIMLTMSDVTEEQEILNRVILSCNDQTETSESRLTLKPAKILTSLTTRADGIIGMRYDAGEYVNYYINVKNISEEKLKDVKIKYELPEELEYVKGGLTAYDEFEGYSIIENVSVSNNIFEYTIDKFRESEEITLAVVAKVKKLEEGFEKEIVSFSNVDIDGEIYETNIKKIITEQSSYTMTLKTNVDEKTVLKQGDEVIYTLELKNTGMTDITPDINIDIPKELEVVKIEEYINNEVINVMDTVRQNIEWTSSLEKDDILRLEITTKVATIEVDKITNLELITSAIVTNADEEMTSNEVKVVIQPELKQEDEDEEDDFEEDEEYYDEEDDEDLGFGELGPDDPGIDNPGTEDPGTEDPGTDDPGIDNPGTEDPGTEDPGTEDPGTEDPGTEDPGTEDPGTEDPGAEDPGTQDPGTQDPGTEDPGAEDPGTEDPGTEDPGAEDPGTEDPGTEDPGTQDTIVTYTISGVAWQDLDKNGIRNENENLKQGIIVSLINIATGNFALDGNGNKITTITDEQGKYIFTNIPSGVYAVMFEFNTDEYTVTTYQKDGVNEIENSDAILSTVSIDGQTKKVGITDKIELNSNIENLDIGFIQNAIFNLSLDKKITKITVVDKQGTKEYTYKDGHTAKVDLVAKYMNGANVIVNYNFTITNDGEVTGYVDSLVDNLPSGLEFNSEINKDWYKGSDGKLYTKSLSGIAIKPGESTQIDLVLTKTMTEENAGTFVNSANLEKISNLENIQEKENALEGNESSAILIISIKTGSVILYLGITMICLAIIGAGVYLINKKILIRGI